MFDCLIKFSSSADAPELIKNETVGKTAANPFNVIEMILNLFIYTIR